MVKPLDGLQKTLLSYVCVGCCLSGLAGCSDESTGPGPQVEALPSGCDALVKPSSDDQTALQTALIEAKEGSTVCLAEGSFSLSLEVQVSTPGLTLKGAGKELTILDFSGQISGANGVHVMADNVTVRDLQVKNTAGDGIRATAVKNIAFLGLRVLWEAKGSPDNGDYGLYPVQSEGVRVENSVISGARDVGIYVGQSRNIVVRNNETFENVAGIEAENSTDADIHDNLVHDNTAGILILNLPERPMLAGDKAKVHHNTVENNNLPNFAEMGTIASLLPQGTGMILLAADNNEIHDNTFSGNNSVGILITGYSEQLFGTYNDVNFDVYSQGNYVHNNAFSGNGASPEGIVKQLIPTAPVPDMLFDGCVDAGLPNADGALTNCFKDNGQAPYLNFDLCGGGASADPDIMKVTCEHPALPSKE